MFVAQQAKQWQCVFFNRLDNELESASVASVYSKIIETITGFSNGAWVVDYSCNGVVAGVPGDGVNRINSQSDVVMSSEGNAHSWIVLSQSGLSNNFQMLMNFTSTNVLLSFTWDQPFLGGTSINAPQSTTQQNTITGWTGNNRGESQSYYIIQSEDGEVLRISSQGAGSDFTQRKEIFVEKINNHGDLHTNPFFIRVDFRNYIADIGNNIKQISFGYDLISSGQETHCMSNFWGGEYRYTHFQPIIVDSSDHVIGNLADFGIGRAESHAKTKTYEDSHGGYWLQLGDFLYPWNSNVKYF